ncbi:GDP-L-fucose synthase family protein [Salinicola halophyticus]|uniref:GDP-L-fucose synthase family protein n=1 Tax=Salinicola halophyticus TaxID=1808881 RepID=UPI003F44ADB1
MKILLTGGSGMVGQNLLEHTAAKEYEILAPSSRELDLLNKDSVANYLKAHNPTLIIHAGGKVGGIQANMADPVAFLSQNAEMGLNLFTAASAHGVPYCINLASSCMYPRNASNPLREEKVLTGELEPTNEGYALAKILATRLCQYITDSSEGKKQYLTLIPCNLYGPHDKFDPDKSHMIPAVIRKIHEAKQAKRDTVEIWGDGEARREFMYVGDLADSVFTIVEKMLNRERLPTLMNVGLGHDYSINDYYKSVAEVVGYKGEFTHDLTKPVGMRQKLVDSQRINDAGWAPAVSLQNGIFKTYQYFLEL